MYFSNSTKRNRGVVLTAKGWHKLKDKEVLHSEYGDRLSLEKLGERANLDRRTVSKIIGRKQGVDRRTIQLFFEAFDLKLEEEDYTNRDRQSGDKPIEIADGEIDYFPDGPVPLQSRFYIERPPIEELAKSKINAPGSIVRIKAPQQMGKSSLLQRVMEVAIRQKYRVVHLDLQQADQSVYLNSDLFLRWFCANVALKLGFKPHLKDYWDEDIGSKVCCTTYFEEYILEKINTPLILILNEVNLIFEHPTISKDFLPLLRFWHEQAKQDEVFQKLRLVITHSTEVYVPLNIHQSPFNVGLTLKLPPFNQEQIEELARLYDLDCMGANEVKELMKMVGGHPFLIRLALYHLSQHKITLEQVLEQAPTQEGIYRHHLQSQLNILRQKPNLLAAFQKIINAEKELSIDRLLAYQLERLGLIRFVKNGIEPACQLYNLYFKSLEVKVLNTKFMIQDE